MQVGEQSSMASRRTWDCPTSTWRPRGRRCTTLETPRPRRYGTRWNGLNASATCAGVTRLCSSPSAAASNATLRYGEYSAWIRRSGACQSSHRQQHSCQFFSAAQVVSCQSSQQQQHRREDCASRAPLMKLRMYSQCQPFFGTRGTITIPPCVSTSVSTQWDSRRFVQPLEWCPHDGFDIPLYNIIGIGAATGIMPYLVMQHPAEPVHMQDKRCMWL